MRQNLSRPPINWLGLSTLIRREVEQFLDFYVQSLLGPIITLMLFMVVFGVAMGEHAAVKGVPFLIFLTPGLIMMAILQNTFLNPSGSLIIAKIQGNIVDTLMAPLTPFEIVVGYCLGGVLRGIMIGIASLVVVSMWVDLPFNYPLFILLNSLNGAVMMGLIGTLTGIRANKFDDQATISFLVVNPLAFLSGTFYSVDQLPGIWGVVAHINPFFFLIDGFRYGFTGISDANPYLGFMIVFFMNIALFILVWKLIKSGYKLKT